MNATIPLDVIRKDVDGWPGEFQVVVWQSNDQVADITYVKGDDDYEEIAQGLDLHVAESLARMLNATRQLLSRNDEAINLDARDAEIIKLRRELADARRDLVRYADALEYANG